LEVETARFDLAAFDACVDLAFGEGFEESPVFLAFSKGLNLPGDNLGDEIPESERRRAFVRGRRNGEGKTWERDLLLPNDAEFDVNHDRLDPYTTVTAR
jgi:hypothetical protein